MRTKKQTNYYRWVLLGFAALLLATPQATVLKTAVNDLDPYLLNTIRFGLVALVAVPFIFRDRRLITRRSVGYILLAGCCLAVAAFSLVYALKFGSASYASLLLLLTPVFLVAYAVKLDGEAVSARTVAGIAVSVTEALVLACYPLLSNGSKILYPLATVLLLINALVYPFVTLSYKWANEREKVPLPIVVGLSAVVVSLISLGLWLSTGAPKPSNISPGTIAAIAYSGLVVSLLSKVSSVVAFKHVGAAVIGSLMYMQSFVTVLLPVVVLGESLTAYMIFGGLLIVGGAVVVQMHVRHKTQANAPRHKALAQLKHWMHDFFAS